MHMLHCKLISSPSQLHLHLHIFSQSYREFKKADIEMWMKAVNIDVYWSCFERGGITDGESLETVDTETLIVGYGDKFTEIIHASSVVLNFGY